MAFHTRTVVVSGMSTYSPEELEQYVGQIAKVEHVLIKSTSAAYVVLKELKEVTQVVDQLNKSKFKDEYLVVELTTFGDEMKLAGLVKVKEDSQTSSSLMDLMGRCVALSSGDRQTLLATLHPLDSKTGIASPPSGSSDHTPPHSGQVYMPSPAMINTTPIRLSPFSGDNAKGDIGFDQWKFEVKGLQLEGVSERRLVHEMRRSLRGTAAEALLQLGENVVVDAVLVEFECIFGNVLPVEALYQEFFSARQKDPETITVWACRLKEILRQLEARSSDFTVQSSKRILRRQLWYGLHNEAVKNALRHTYQSECSQEEFLMAARRTELEYSGSLGKKTAQLQQHESVQSNDISKKLDMIMSKLSGLESRLSKVENPSKYLPSSGKKESSTPVGDGKLSIGFVPTCHHCGKKGHIRPNCYQLNTNGSTKGDDGRS